MVVLVPITQAAGEALKAVVGPIPAVLVHEGYGLMMLPWTIAVAVVAIGEWGRVLLVQRPDEGLVAHCRARVWQIVIAVAELVIAAAGSLVVVFLTGEAGTRAVWEGLFPN